ncbi:MAG: Glycosyl transferase family 2 [Candidatus Gottesmanbacteria bacterium GW2011_GWB1_44_11c]|uniref:Glycosyl transferase family 2 n=1 Tax=Candidatus Gottesmanbacteria bacterium GW2011_GWB1_44_11c TaxID=1618447 RepID=A0A0G1JIC0_9BACT|nr:MAG: Glycosyl transferase family 2 [Candidatus Gottesmanbacteria bacterium GW2011_GWB1_44_11c]
MVYIFSYKYARVHVKSVIKNLPSIPNSECFSVDYESSDGTVEYFEKHDIPVIHQKKKGRSEAFRIGAQHAKGRYLVFFSPDGNEDPADIPKLVYTVKNGADLAIASRFMKGSRNEEDDRILKFRKWAKSGIYRAGQFCMERSSDGFHQRVPRNDKIRISLTPA